MEQQNAIKIQSEKANDFKNVCKQIGIEVIKKEQPNNQSQSTIKQPFQLNSSTNSQFNHKRQQQMDFSSDSQDSDSIQIEENQQETIHNQIDQLVEIQKKKLSKYNSDLRDLDWQMLIDESKYSQNYIYKRNNNPKTRSDQKPQQQQQMNQQYHSLNVFLKEFTEFDNNKQETESSISQQHSNNNQFDVYGNIVRSIKDDLKKLRIYNGNDYDVQKMKMFQDVLKDSSTIQEIDTRRDDSKQQYQSAETEQALKELFSSVQIK